MPEVNGSQNDAIKWKKSLKYRGKYMKKWLLLLNK